MFVLHSTFKHIITPSSKYISLLSQKLSLANGIKMTGRAVQPRLGPAL